MDRELNFKKVGNYDVLTGYATACKEIQDYLTDLLKLASTKEEINLILMAQTKVAQRLDGSTERQEEILDSMASSRLTD